LLLPVALLIGGISIFHFARSANFIFFYEWKSDASTKTMMKDLNQIHESGNHKSDKKVEFHPYSYFATTSMFYKYLFGYGWMEPVDYSNRISHAEDYYYLPSDSKQLLDGHHYEIIKTYPLSQTLLAKNSDKRYPKVYFDKSLNMYDTVMVNPGLIRSFRPALFNGHSSIEMNTGSFSPEIKFDAHIIANLRDIVVKAEANVYFPNGKSGEFNIVLQDKDGKILKWNALRFEDYLLQKDGWMTVPFKINYKKIDQNAAFIKIFTWNSGNKLFYIASIKARITGF
jgi:hypothetical protein